MSLSGAPFVKGSPKLVPRVLDVVKGQLCFVIGTVYMDMPLKPNVLEDVGRDVSRNHLYLFPSTQ
jgi:DNA polymerase delta subunit 2